MEIHKYKEAIMKSTNLHVYNCKQWKKFFQA